jgi:hypothetical protein
MPSKNTARWGRRQSRQASGGAGGFAVFGQFGNLGAKKAPTGAEQPFGTIVDGRAPGEPPKPLTLNHPASDPGCSSGWGSFFLGHHRRGRDFEKRKINSTDRHLVASGLAQFGMSIRLSRRRGIDRTGCVSAVPLEAVSVGGLFCFDTSIRTDRRMVVNFATRKERRWRFRVVATVGEAFLRGKIGTVSALRSSVPIASAQRRRRANAGFAATHGTSVVSFGRGTRKRG